MNCVCPNVRHENISLWSSSWRLKFIHSQFPLPIALNSVFSFIKMSDKDLKFVYLFCQTDTFLFIIETPIRKCKHPLSQVVFNAFTGRMSPPWRPKVAGQIGPFWSLINLI